MLGVNFITRDYAVNIVLFLRLGLNHRYLLLVYPNRQPSSSIIDSNPAKLIPQLLDQLIGLGELARLISRALGSNGRRPEKVTELIKQLAAEVDDDS